MGEKKLPPPKHLSAPRRALWVQITSDWELGPDELEILRLACESLDVCERARKDLAKGLTIEGRYGPRAHPSLAIARDQYGLAARLLRQLGLEAPEPTPANRRHRAPDRKASNGEP